MEKYTGNVPIPQDENNHDVVLEGLHSYITRTQDVNRIPGSAAEKAEIVAATGIALNRIRVPQVHNRRTINEFELECLIGFGSFGQIWKAEHEKFGSVALKQLKADPTGLTDLWKERDLLVLLKHKRICNLAAAFYDKDIYFVLQLCHGSVSHLCTRISKENAVRFAVQLLQAVEWIHSNHVIHADIKPDNCLINTSNNLVLSDFGSAVYLGPNRTMVKFSTNHGSPGYMDYRANKNLEFLTSTDVFSAACVIFEISTKTPLLFYQDQHEQSRQVYIDAFDNGRIMQASSSGGSINVGEREHLSDRAMKCNFGYLLKKMIQEENRLTAPQALEDSALRAVLQDAKVILENVDTSQKFVTREYTSDFSYSFDNISSYSTPELDLALLTFAYEEPALAESTKSAPTETSTSGDEPEPVVIIKNVHKKGNKKRKISKHSSKKRLRSSSYDGTSDTDSDSS